MHSELKHSSTCHYVCTKLFPPGFPGTPVGKYSELHSATPRKKMLGGGYVLSVYVYVSVSVSLSVCLCVCA
jgi:hypothetical protein